MADILHCRLPPDLLEKIDDQVERLRAEGIDPELATRSGVARTLIAKGLGEGVDEVVSREVTKQVYAYLQRVAAAVMGEVKARLPEIAAGTGGGRGGVAGARRKRR